MFSNAPVKSYAKCEYQRNGSSCLPSTLPVLRYPIRNICSVQTSTSYILNYLPSQQIGTMSTSQPERTAPASESSSSEDLEVQELDLDHDIHHTLFLQDTNFTKATVVAAEEFSRRKTAEEGQKSNEKTKHVGFWHTELNNVRLHVLKLWARTGETNQNLFLILAIDCLSISSDTHGLRLTCALPL